MHNVETNMVLFSKKLRVLLAPKLNQDLNLRFYLHKPKLCDLNLLALAPLGAGCAYVGACAELCSPRSQTRLKFQAVVGARCARPNVWQGESLLPILKS